MTEAGIVTDTPRLAADIDLVLMNGRAVWRADRHTGERPGRMRGRETA